MNCHNCGAPRRFSVCDYCGVADPATQQRMAVVGQSLVVYDADGVTPVQKWELTDKPRPPPTSVPGSGQKVNS